MIRFIVFLTLFNLVNCVKILDILKPCYRNDPNITECLKENIQYALEDLEDGIQEFGIQKLDPCRIEDIKLEQKTGLLLVRAIVKNLNIIGLSKSKILNVKSNFQNDSMYLEIELFNKKVNFEGYSIGETGTESFLLDTKIYFDHTFRDSNFTWKIHGVPEVKDGKTYMKINKFIMEASVGRMTPRFKAAYFRDTILVRLLQEFVQAFWRALYDRMLPIYEKNWNRIGLKMSNQIFLNVPYDELFPIRDN